eukprot:COSAG01_NODE_128_length_24936_cov_324.347264_5_plen_164_part_00
MVLTLGYFIVYTRANFVSEVVLAVKIRLQRRGKKRYPVYRVVVMDSRVQRDGAVLETLGQYNPNQEPALINYNKERLSHWVGQGAQATDPILRLFLDDKVLPEKQLTAYKRRVAAKKAAVAAKAKAEKAKADKEKAEKAKVEKAEAEKAKAAESAEGTDTAAS